MGHEEIQAPSSASASRRCVARGHEGKASRPVRSLVGQGCVCGWNDGSPVNREVRAGFCEKLGVRFPRLTHLETAGDVSAGALKKITARCGIILMPDRICE